MVVNKKSLYLNKKLIIMKAINDTMQLSQLVQDVINGNEDPILAVALIRDLKNLCLLAEEEIIDYAIQEAEKHDKTFSMEGYKITRKDGSKRFEFDNDQEWLRIKDTLKAREAKLKNAYNSSLQGLLSVEKDGEVLELPTVTFTKPSLTIKPKS